MRITALTILLLLFTGVVICQETNAEQAGWRVTLESGQVAPSTFTAQNRCKREHGFNIELENLSFLSFGQMELTVKGGKNKTIPVSFDTNGLTPAVYSGKVTVICVTCKKEPGCTQDREILPVFLTVTGDPLSNPTSGNKSENTISGETVPNADPSNPCDRLKDKCEDLRRAADEKEAVAVGVEAAAATARGKADQLASAAKTAREAADAAEAAAKPPASTGGGAITSDGETFTTADEKWLSDKRAKVNADYQSGKITVQQYQSRRNALSGRAALRQARQERIANAARLRREAAAAKTKAEQAQGAADGAETAAEAVETAARDARAAADAARKTYDDCVEKVAAECREWKRLQEEARKSAEAAEAARIEAEKRRKVEELIEKRAREKLEYQLLMIKRLGLIDSSGITEVTGIWDWLPDILEEPVGGFFEGLSQSPIPISTLTALGNTYGIAGKWKDPCYGLGYSKTVERLQREIDPATRRPYQLNAAQNLADDLCVIIGGIRARAEAIHRAGKR